MKRLTVWCGLTLLGCIGGDAPATVGPVIVSAVDTLIDTQSGSLASVVDMDVAPTGILYLADYQARQILRFDPESGDTLRLGRPGEGPGELDGPWSIRALPHGVMVVDRGNGRIQRLTESGEFLSSAPVSPMVMRSFPFLGADGGLVIGTGGQDSCLAIVFDSTATEVRRVGTPVVVPPVIADFQAIKSKIREGEVPADLRNEALVAAGPGGGTWIALTTEGEIQRYGPDGALAWITSISEPEMAWSRSEFFRKNAAEDNPARFFSLRYFRDLAVVGEELWLLLDTPPDGPGVVVVAEPDGSTRRIEIVGAGSAVSMAVDHARGRLFLYTYDDAQLLLAQLPSPFRAS
jgi:hypothetical protein